MQLKFDLYEYGRNRDHCGKGRLQLFEPHGDAPISFNFLEEILHFVSFLVNILVELGALNTVLAGRYDGRGALLHDTTADVVACIHQAFLLGLDKFFDQNLSLDAVVPLRPCEYEVQGVSQAM